MYAERGEGEGEGGREREREGIRIKSSALMGQNKRKQENKHG